MPRTLLNIQRWFLLQRIFNMNRQDKGSTVILILQTQRLSDHGTEFQSLAKIIWGIYVRVRTSIYTYGWIIALWFIRAGFILILSFQNSTGPLLILRTKNQRHLVLKFQFIHSPIHYPHPLQKSIWKQNKCVSVNPAMFSVDPCLEGLICTDVATLPTVTSMHHAHFIACLPWTVPFFFFLCANSGKEPYLTTALSIRSG